MTFIRRFRSSSPILYVGSMRCRLVIHKFAYWADLTRLVREQREAKARYQYHLPIDVNSVRSDLPTGAVLHPSLKQNLVDLSDGSMRLRRHRLRIGDQSPYVRCVWSLLDCPCRLP